MLRKIQNQIIILMTLITLILFIGIYLLRSTEKEKINILLLEQLKSNGEILDKIIDFRSKSLQTFVYDYTFWDEMVSFVKSGDKKWAKQNIQVSLGTYNVDFAWVYRNDLSLIYSVNRIGTDSLKYMPYPYEVLKKIVSKGKFYHFFVLTNLGLLEISGASIHPSVDIERKTPRQGYFFAGRIWTKNFLEEISLFTGSEIKLVSLREEPTKSKVSINDKYLVFNVKTLADWDGSPVINIVSKQEAKIANVLSAQSNLQFIITIVVAISIIIATSIILYRLVNRPLNIISRSLLTGDPAYIENLQNYKNEFGNLANLIKEFFVQKQKLVNEIAERKNVEAALRESETKLREIVEHSTNLFYTHTTDHIMTYVSPQSKYFFDCDPEEAKVKWTEFVTDNPINYEGFLKTQKAIETGKRQPPYELELKTKTGRKLWVEVNESPIVIDGKTVAIVGSLTDITEKKIAQKELEEKEELIRHSQKMESIGTLAGGIAHDFNNILAIIMGHATLLEMSKNNPQKILDSANIIKKVVDRGAGLVKQILTFARKTDIKMESININNIIEELIQLLIQTFPKTIRIESNLTSDLPKITGDHNQIHQALLNISVNARDAMPHGGVLTFTSRIVSREEIKTQFVHVPEKKYICITISDTGIGMEEKTLKRIFEPFFTTKEFGKGTGLGLSTVYGIMQGHRGFINAKSKVGEGTTFYLYFPLIDQITNLDEDRTEQSVAIKGGKETILVVEDEEMLLDLLVEVLSKHGYNVLTSKSGLDAINVYEEHKHEIALVLTDMGLPQLNGYDLFNRLKQINPDIKLIFASGYFDPNLISEMYKLGAKEFVPKPYNPENVLQKIRHVLDQEI